MPILSVFATLLKSRFFVIYFRGVTLAGRRTQRGIVGCNRWFHMVQYPHEREGLRMIKVLFVCHGRISLNSEKSLCL